MHLPLPAHLISLCEILYHPIQKYNDKCNIYPYIAPGISPQSTILTLPNHLCERLGVSGTSGIRHPRYPSAHVDSLDGRINLLDMKPHPRLQVRQQVSRLVGITAVLLAGSLWYYQSPLRDTKPMASPELVGVRMTPSLQQERQLTAHSSARAELPMLERSIYRLRALKQRSPEQQRRLDTLLARQHDWRRLEDYQLRQSLHAQDSSFDHRAMQLRIDQLQVRLDRPSTATD